MTVLLLCRHGRTDWNDQGRYQGQTDVPLNAVGRRQARLLAELLRAEPISAVYASDLSRAAETAAEIAREHGLPVRLDARLREINQGRWEGLTVAQIMERDAELFRCWQRTPLQVQLPEGESIQDVRARVLAWLREALGRHGGGTICVVTHKVALTVLRCELTGEPLVEALRHLPPNASYQRVAVPPGWTAR